MARNVLIQPRSGARAAISGLTSASAQQQNNELLLDTDNKEMYVGTGGGTYGGKYTRPLTFNTSALAQEMTIVPAVHLLPLHTGATGEMRKITIAQLINEIQSETGGDTKDLKVTTDDTTPGVLDAKITNTTGIAGITKSVNNPTGNATMSFQIGPASVGVNQLAENIFGYNIELNAHSLGPSSTIIGSGAANLWTGSTIMSHVTQTTFSTIHYFVNTLDPVSGSSAFRTMGKAAINALLVAFGKEIKAGDKLLAGSTDTDTAGGSHAVVYTVDSFTGDTVNWDGPAEVATTQRFATDVNVINTSEFNDENNLFFVDVMQTMKRLRTIAMQTYTGHNGIDITGDQISVDLASDGGLSTPGAKLSVNEGNGLHKVSNIISVKAQTGVDLTTPVQQRIGVGGNGIYVPLKQNGGLAGEDSAQLNHGMYISSIDGGDLS